MLHGAHLGLLIGKLVFGGLLAILDHHNGKIGKSRPVIVSS